MIILLIIIEFVQALAQQKYFSYFLKGIECNNKECLFLHKWAGENDIIKRGDLNSNKAVFNQQHNYVKK